MVIRKYVRDNVNEIVGSFDFKCFIYWLRYIMNNIIEACLDMMWNMIDNQVVPIVDLQYGMSRAYFKI